MPVALGHEGGGVVESVGEGVDEFVPGDHVSSSETSKISAEQQLELRRLLAI